MCCFTSTCENNIISNNTNITNTELCCLLLVSDFKIGKHHNKVFLKDRFIGQSQFLNACFQSASYYIYNTIWEAVTLSHAIYIIAYCQTTTIAGPCWFQLKTMGLCPKHAPVHYVTLNLLLRLTGISCCFTPHHISWHAGHIAEQRKKKKRGISSKCVSDKGFLGIF